MNLEELTSSKQWKKFMAKLYGWGASVVIVGALFKIQHWPGAGVMLTVGLGTEAVIFFFSAFEPIHEEVDWSLVYPELAGLPGEEGEKRGTPVEELDKMLEEAKIGPELLDSVGKGLKSLGETTSKLADLSNASVATNEYVSSVKSATESVSELSHSYQKASRSMSDLSSLSEDIKSSNEQMKSSAQNYNDQMTSASKNLSALNAVYELQLQDANTQLKSTAKLYEGINEMMGNLNASMEDTKKYKDQISSLAKNLAALNTIYGNMLSAMNMNR